MSERLSAFAAFLRRLRPLADGGTLTGAIFGGMVDAFDDNDMRPEDMADDIMFLLETLPRLRAAELRIAELEIQIARMRGSIQ